MIVVKQRPYTYCMTGNPVAYELYSALAAANANVYFEVKIRFTSAYNIFWVDGITFPVYPVNGTAKFDIKDILDSLLEYETPVFDANEKLASEIKKQVGNFYIQFRELIPNATSPSFDDTESFFPKTIIKAGMNYLKYRGDNFWVNYFEGNNPFLTWQESGRLASLSERMYLGFFLTLDLPSWSIPEVVGPNLWQAMQVFYTDGTSSAVMYVDLPANYKHSLNFAPCGADQWSLNTLDPSKKIWYWKTRMEYTSANDGTKTPLNDWFIFYNDNRNDYNSITLNYRNSLGCIDSARVRGVIEKNLNYSYDQQARTFLPDYFSGDAITPAVIIANSKEDVIFKGEIGHVSKNTQERLRDLHLMREVWWEIGKKWWPVKLLTPSGKMKTSDDHLWSIPIEFGFAYAGDHFYTPDIDLGDRTFDDNVCSAEIVTFGVDVDTSGPTASAEFTFTRTPASVAQYTYQIIGVHADPIVANIADLPLVINGLAKEEDFIIEIRPICSNGIYGRKYEFPFNTVGDGGSGGSGGTGGSGNSQVNNNTALTQAVVIKVNDVVVFSGSVPEGGQRIFNVADTADAEVEMTLDTGPAVAELFTDGGTNYHGLILANVVTFSNVNIVGGIQIDFI